MYLLVLLGLRVTLQVGTSHGNWTRHPQPWTDQSGTAHVRCSSILRLMATEHMTPATSTNMNKKTMGAAVLFFLAKRRLWKAALALLTSRTGNTGLPAWTPQLPPRCLRISASWNCCRAGSWPSSIDVPPGESACVHGWIDHVKGVRITEILMATRN